MGICTLSERADPLVEVLDHDVGDGLGRRTPGAAGLRLRHQGCRRLPERPSVVEALVVTVRRTCLAGHDQRRVERFLPPVANGTHLLQEHVAMHVVEVRVLFPHIHLGQQTLLQRLVKLFGQVREVNVVGTHIDNGVDGLGEELNVQRAVRGRVREQADVALRPVVDFGVDHRGARSVPPCPQGVGVLLPDQGLALPLHDQETDTGQGRRGQGVERHRHRGRAGQNRHGALALEEPPFPLHRHGLEPEPLEHHVQQVVGEVQVVGVQVGADVVEDFTDRQAGHRTSPESAADGSCCPPGGPSRPARGGTGLGGRRRRWGEGM